MSLLLLLWSCSTFQEELLQEDAPGISAPGMLSVEEREALYRQARRDLEAMGVDTVQWGLTPYATPVEVLSQYGPILDFIQDELGLSFSVVVAESYHDLESRIVDGEVDVAVLSPYNYVRTLRRAPGIHLVASHIANGSTSYGAYLFTRVDSGIKSIEDLRGKPFGFVDRRSTSGWLFPAERMLQEDLHPIKDVEPRFLGDHTQVVSAVLEGEVVAGASYDSILMLTREQRSGAGQLRIFAKTRRIPHDAYITRGSFPESANQALSVALSQISTRTPAGQQVLKGFARINGFYPAETHEFDVILDVERVVHGALDPGTFSAGDFDPE